MRPDKNGQQRLTFETNSVQLASENDAKKPVFFVGITGNTGTRVPKKSKILDYQQSSKDFNLESEKVHVVYGIDTVNLKVQPAAYELLSNFSFGNHKWRYGKDLATQGIYDKLTSGSYVLYARKDKGIEIKLSGAAELPYSCGSITVQFNVRKVLSKALSEVITENDFISVSQYVVNEFLPGIGIMAIPDYYDKLTFSRIDACLDFYSQIPGQALGQLLYQSQKYHAAKNEKHRPERYNTGFKFGPKACKWVCYDKQVRERLDYPVYRCEVRTNKAAYSERLFNVRSYADLNRFSMSKVLDRYESDFAFIGTPVNMKLPVANELSPSQSDLLNKIHEVRKQPGDDYAEQVLSFLSGRNYSSSKGHAKAFKQLMQFHQWEPMNEFVNANVIREQLVMTSELKESILSRVSSKLDRIGRFSA